MATIARQKPQREPDLAATVPAPFPTELLQQRTQNPFLLPEELAGEEFAPLGVVPTVTSSGESVAQDALNEIMPSITTLQKSCIMTLNTLLSGSDEWKSIVPDRRHSMPSSPGMSSTHLLDFESSTSALETLVANLRKQQQASIDMVEFHEPVTESGLSHELQERIRKLAPSLSPKDASLANSLATILTHFGRLSSLQALHPSTHPSTSTHTPTITDAPPPINMYDALTRQLNDLQLERLTTQTPPVLSSLSSKAQMETSILWSQIDRELENIVTMCMERTERVPRFYQENLPPQYDFDYDELYDFESPPEYDGTGRASLEISKECKLERVLPSPTAPSRITDEKMRLDLEGIAMAIDRLYLVAPQLHNQRVELKSSKLAQLEKARKEGSASSSRKGKERDKKELEHIIEMIGKASERSLKDQSVMLEGGMHSRLEKAKLKDQAKRDAFVENLLKHSAAGRMHRQDAFLNPRIKDPQAKLTFPEFIRETIYPDSELLQDPSVMLTLPEFVAQHLPEDMPIAPETAAETNGKPKKKGNSRHRSLSAPPLAWLRSATKLNSSQGSGKSSIKETNAEAFDIVYVAENHENLHHVLVFFTATRQMPTSGLSAEILPPFPEHISTGGDYLVIKSGTNASLPLILPARTAPGKKEIQAQSKHFEIKLGTLLSSGLPEDGSDALSSAPLLDATKLEVANPTSFICASCSLPLIQPSSSPFPSSLPSLSPSLSLSPPNPSSPSRNVSNSGHGMTYRDLPSEHWEELVEAWMCHVDQKLHDQAVKHGRAGFWPKPGQAFVGGSYILFEESVIVQQNLLAPQDDKHDDNWKVRRCLCGAIIGRSQTKAGDELQDHETTCFKVLKYAIRPITPNLPESLKIPLSAFIVEDMMEYVQAHASYRFVIRDEEDEQARILIWLFKPKIRLSYTTPRSRAIPKSGSITAAKVLYKLIGPSEAKVDLKTLLNRYPGFPQAEYLSYPMSICRRVAVLLKESNTAYPESLRKMTGLEVGWLHRR